MTCSQQMRGFRRNERPEPAVGLTEPNLAGAMGGRLRECAEQHRSHPPLDGIAESTRREKADGVDGRAPLPFLCRRLEPREKRIPARAREHRAQKLPPAL